MPLVSSTLAQQLLAISQNPPKDYVAAGKRWAAAYEEYASSAQSLAGAPPASLTAGRQVLATALATTFASSRNPVQTANQIASALTAFWLSPPVAFGPGAVTAVGGTSVLASALSGVWASNTVKGTTNASATQRMATVIDAFTHTVIVTTPGVPPIIGPIL